MPLTLPVGNSHPKISVITPSFNQAEYLEETIRSVLLQDYPNLEYIIIDGGSTDGSLEIIRKYESRIFHWSSEPDQGQSDAINKGFALASGEIITYLNSDDIYFPNVLRHIAACFLQDPDVGVVVGGIASANQDSQLGVVRFPKLPQPAPVDLTLLEPDSWYLPQASAFFSRKLLQTIGMWVREDLHYTMDRELFFRAVKASKVNLCTEVFSTYRHHQESKTTSSLAEAYKELPRTFAYCDWGSNSDKKRRKIILRKRIAEGYYYLWRTSSDKFVVKYFLQAVLLRPEYLLKKAFLKNALKRILGRSSYTQSQGVY